MNKINRIKELVKLLNHYRNEYYNNSNSEISDYEYDLLFDELNLLEKETHIILSNSPTQEVGYSVKSNLEKSYHKYPMLSLDKTKSIEEIKKYIGDKKALAMLKLDGLSISLTYENGILKKAESRGNGIVGEDLTHNIKAFKNVPLRIPVNNEVVIYGEAIIKLDDFERINSRIPKEQQFKTARNLVSGSVRQLDSKVCAAREVHFFAWRVVRGIEENNFSARLGKLIEFGFDIVPLINLINITVKTLLRDVEILKNIAEMAHLPIDGIVFSFAETDYMESLGATSHHLRGQKAFKFKESEAESTIRQVEFSISQSGVLTPVAIFDPIDIDGTSISRASLHNLSVMKQLNIKIGANVTVVKKNEIIPQIIFSDGIGKDVDIPTRCPACGENTIINKDNHSSVETLICQNSYCIGKRLEKLKRFCSKEGINIEGLSGQTLSKLIDEKLIKDIPDIYELKKYRDKLIALDGFGVRKVDNLLASIDKSVNTTLDKIIYAVGVKGVGKSQAKLIADVCHYDWKEFCSLFDGVKDKSMYLLCSSFGQAIGENLYNWWADNETKVLRVLIDNKFILSTMEKNIVNKSLLNKSFVITGDTNIFKSRKECQKFIESHGGHVSSTVSKNTSYLICNVPSTSNKFKKAIELNVQIINEEQLKKMIL